MILKIESAIECWKMKMLEMQVGSAWGLTVCEHIPFPRSDPSMLTLEDPLSWGMLIHSVAVLTSNQIQDSL